MTPAQILSMCSGKDKLTRKQADEIVRRANFGGCNAYRCSACGSWHVGRSNRMPQKRAAMRGA